MNFRPSAKELRDFGLLTGGVAVLLGVYYFFFKNINWISILILVGVILTLFFPNLEKESLAKKNVIQKIFTILIMFLGTYFLYT